MANDSFVQINGSIIYGAMSGYALKLFVKQDEPQHKV